MIIFRKHYVQNSENGKKCRVWYSIGGRRDGRKCVTLYAKDYCDSMDGVIAHRNGTDTMTDYFEKDKAILFEDHPQYEEALKMALTANKR